MAFLSGTKVDITCKLVEFSYESRLELKKAFLLINENRHVFPFQGKEIWRHLQNICFAQMSHHSNR